MASRAPALRLADITKVFGAVVANRDVTLEVGRGEVHALMGENGAGKTTLMRIAAGMLEPDSGRIEIDGAVVRFRKPEHALAAGVGMVHQHFTLVPTLTAAENMALRRSLLPRRANLKAVGDRAAVIARDLGFEFKPDKRIADYTLAGRQRLEIIKLLDRGVDVLIFDEPSASLPPSEWSEIARVMRALAEEGKAIVLITHRIDEVFTVADRFTVLRDGAVTGRGAIAEIDEIQLVEYMVGRKVSLRPERVRIPATEPVLSIRHLSVPADKRRSGMGRAIRHASFDVRAHEIVGVAGAAGSGQDELVETLVGIKASSEGSVSLAGRPFDVRTPREFHERGGAYIPEDRHHAGIALELTVWENLLMREATRPPLARRGLIQPARAQARAQELVDDYDIRAQSPATPIRQLSGGNQQKVVVARELASRPCLVIAVQPTRGLDVRAAEFVYQQLNRYKQQGGAVLLVSLDLDEVIALSDRIVVLAGGAVQGIVEADDASRQSVGSFMTRAGRAG